MRWPSSVADAVVVCASLSPTLPRRSGGAAQLEKSGKENGQEGGGAGPKPWQERVVIILLPADTIHIMNMFSHDHFWSGRTITNRMGLLRQIQ